MSDELAENTRVGGDTGDAGRVREKNVGTQERRTWALASPGGAAVRPRFLGRVPGVSLGGELGPQRATNQEKWSSRDSAALARTETPLRAVPSCSDKASRSLGPWTLDRSKSRPPGGRRHCRASRWLHSCSHYRQGPNKTTF